MAQSILLAGEVLSLSAAAADRLLSSGNGDAALLYLHLLRRGGTFSPESARQALGWADTRVREAYDQLGRLALVDKRLAAETTRTPPEPDGPPDYTLADITKEMEEGGTFPQLVREMERRLGKVLSPADLKILLSLYDYLALPAEVILILTTWCMEETEAKYGPGRKPRMSQIRKTAFAWHRLGVDTPEAADAHIKSLTALKGRERTLAPLLGLSGRSLVEGERRYIHAWVDMGFDDEAIALAYERTVLKKGGMNWPYMNSILRSWHQKGLHDLAAIEAGDSACRRSGPAPKQGDRSGGQSQRLKKDMDWMDRFLAQTGGETSR